MKKNGATSAGRTRWRCKDPSCGASASRAYDRRSADLRAGLDWLFSKESQEERRIPARSLRRANLLMWDLWPPVPLDRTAHDVVHLDGIHLHRDAVVLIAVSGGHVVGWHVARGETGAACPWRGGSRRCAGGATSTPRSRRRTRGSWPTPSRTNGSRSSTGRHGRKSPQGAWEASGVPMLYGTGIAWDDFHRPSEYHGTPE